MPQHKYLNVKFKLKIYYYDFGLYYGVNRLPFHERTEDRDIIDRKLIYKDGTSNEPLRISWKSPEISTLAGVIINM